ncbi:hypothetical protein B0G57_1422 [Trinickia symbiotica]|nr:hypothetical protein B0G57_1422 [Trinickia symbiotica]
MLSTTAERISCSCFLKCRHQASPVCSSCLIGLTGLMIGTSRAPHLRLYHPPLAANGGVPAALPAHSDGSSRRAAAYLAL